MLSRQAEAVMLKRDGSGGPKFRSPVGTEAVWPGQAAARVDRAAQLAPSRCSEVLPGVTLPTNMGALAVYLANVG